MSDVFRVEEILVDHDTENYDSVLLAVNQLPVRLLDFVMWTGLKNRGYGVRTWGDPTTWERDWLNQCARQNIWRLLFDEQQNLFAQKRITLVPTYHYEEHMWTPGQALSLRFPYITEVNVTRSFVELDNVSVSPYLKTDLTVTASGDFYEVEVEKSVIHNIKHVWFREDSTHENAPIYSVRDPLKERGYPYTDGNSWFFALGRDVSITSVVNAQDSDYIFIDIDPVEDHTISDIIFMHLDQDQEVIQALKPQIVTVGEDTKWRFWFYIWMLKRSEYADEQLDLSEESPFRFLYDELRYGYYEETQALGTVYVKDASCSPDPENDPTFPLLAQLVKGDDGVVTVNPVKLNTSTNEYQIDYSQLTGVPYKVRIYYKTDIHKFGLYVAGTEHLKQAIIAKVAANLPVEECNCGFSENNYITYMREDLPEIIPIPFSQPLANYKFGRRRGDQEFIYRLQNLAVKSRHIRV